MRVTTSGDAAVSSLGADSAPFTVPNYPMFGPDGCLYVLDSGGWAAGNGRVMRVAPDAGQAEVWSDQACGFTSGMALSPDARNLYVVESNLPAIARLPILPDGSAGGRELVAKLSGTVPDGLVFDSEGGLLTACYAPDRILRLPPDGGPVAVLYDDWTRMALNAPTNLTFVGQERDVLAVASFGGQTVMGARAGLRGRPLFWPEVRG